MRVPPAPNNGGVRREGCNESRPYGRFFSYSPPVNGGRGWGAVFLLLLLLLAGRPASAQLANGFYNVTGIEQRVLPNAVQITIRTDGAVRFGVNRDELPGDYSSSNTPVTAFRVRLYKARARLPAFTDLGAYPVDSAVVTLGTDDFKNATTYDGRQPRVDVQLRFFVPVLVRAFGNDSYQTLYLNPRDVSIALGSDRSSVVITVITDRVDARHAGGIRRSPPELQKHRLSLQRLPAPPGETGTGRTRMHISALHTPLAELLQAVGTAEDLPLVVQDGAGDADVSLVLPDATLADLLGALRIGYGLIASPRAPEEGGGLTFGRGDAAGITTSLHLRSLAPDQARLLLPDFLLPSVRVDAANNALVITSTPEVAAKMARDLAGLDLPRPQVRVEVTVWEFASSEDARYALSLTRTLGRESEGLDTDAGRITVLSQAGQTRRFQAAVSALAVGSRARLTARPFLLVASGAQGTFFLGQTRYVTVLQQQGGYGPQAPSALPIQIGYSLSVRPTVGTGDDITLDLDPRVSTVDAIERGTGLPTVGIREAKSVVRVHAGDTVVLGGLDSDLGERTDQGPALFARIPLLRDLFRSHRKSRARTSLILLVTARRA